MALDRKWRAALHSGCFTQYVLNRRVCGLQTPDGLKKMCNIWAVSHSESLASSCYEIQCTRNEQKQAEIDSRRNKMAAIAMLFTVKRKGLSVQRSTEWGKKYSKVQILNVLT